MKKVMSLVAVLAIVCFSAMVFAAGEAKVETAKPEAVSTEPAKVETAKPEAVKAEVVLGKIATIDKAKNEIVIGGKTITVTAESIATLKKGQMVRITLAAGTMNAEKIEVVKTKKAAKKAAKK